MAENSDAVVVPIRALSGRLDNDDPNYVFGGPDIYLTLALAYDSLAAPGWRDTGDGAGEPDYHAMQPRLALDWREEPDGNWIVRLRPDVLSQAGNAFGAEDIAFAIDKAYAHRTLSSWRWREVVGVEGVDVVDRHTIRYRLRAPYPTFPNWLQSVTPNVVDSHTARAHATPGDPWGIDWLNDNVAGYGPYALIDKSEDSMRFRQRPDYWGAPTGARDIELCRVPDRASAFATLEEARAAVVIAIDPDETLKLLRREDVRLLRTWAGHVSVEIDFTRAPFDDKRVRQALAFATPYERILSEGLIGLARPWRSPVKRVSQWYRDEGFPYRHDVARARTLLAEAGHAGGLRSDFHVPRRPDCQRMAEILAVAWREAGVELDIKDIADSSPGWMPPLHLRTECAHNLSEPIYDIAHDYAAMDPLVPPPGGPPNVGTWRPRWVKNEAAIRAYCEMLLEKDPARKRQRFDELQAWLVDFSSSIFLAEVQHVTAVNRHVPDALIAPQSRFFQAIQYQNCLSIYLPERHKDTACGCA